MEFPNFIGVGCQNCGTTWASACLAQHPEIFFAPQKEVSFFDVRFELGLDWYWTQFDGAVREKAVGEWSPGYICHPDAFERLVTHIPDVKIIALFRNPMARLFSHYLRYRSQGATHLPLEEAVNRDPRYVRMSLYADDWEKWCGYFGTERCHGLLFEDLVADPITCLAGIFDFLGVDSSFKADLAAAKEKQNALVLNKFQWIMDLTSRTRDVFQSSFLKPIVPIAKALGVRRVLKQLSSASSTGYQGITMSEEQNWMLYSTYFREDISKLQKLLPSCDLAKWIPGELTVET